MNIVKINSKNTYLLEKFIRNSLPDTFRYFNKRDISCINNHIVTIVGVCNENVVAYGHLDYENDIWLGICVLPEHQGKGYGKQIIKFLINYSEKNKIQKIKLSVDKSNFKAISLYKKNNFQIENLNTDKNYYLMNFTFS